MNEELEYKMYGFTPFNLKEIYQGLQFGHALQEYNNNLNKYYHYGDNTYYFINKPKDIDKLDILKKEFIKWSTIDKTFILLNGGATNWDIDSKGMREIYNNLESNNIPFAYFQEPDSNDSLTAICFLVDERVYDKKKYPDFDKYKACCIAENTLRWGHLFRNDRYEKEIDVVVNDLYKEWVESIGGESNVFLRDFLKDKRLA